MDDVPQAAETASTVVSPSREHVRDRVRAILGVSDTVAAEVVDAFDTFVLSPLRRKFMSMKGSLLARRNPFMYAALNETDVDHWARHVLADMLSSSAEGLMGNWLEEVARIVSGGVKPGSGVDLQRPLPDGTIKLYAIQSTINTKNAGGRRSDLAGLEAAAGALRAQRKHVAKAIAYLFGRPTTTMRNGVQHQSSREFWREITGDDDFLSKLLLACAELGSLYRELDDEIDRIRDEAVRLFGRTDGTIDWSAVLTGRGTTSSEVVPSDEVGG